MATRPGPSARSAPESTAFLLYRRRQKEDHHAMVSKHCVDESFSTGNMSHLCWRFQTARWPTRSAAGRTRSTSSSSRIGNPGNAADTTGNPNPAGSVPYTYRMGKFEISEQMIDKANAVGGLGITKDTRGPDKPATSVSWNEAARFVNWLNTSSGSTPAYKFAIQPGEVGYNANANIELWTISDAGYNPNNLYRNSLARYFLPSVDEWYKAAYYDPTSGVYYDYPTGSDSAPTAVASGTAAGTAVLQSVSSGPADITLAGGLSPYGTMGQGGNVYEWEETDFDLVNGPTLVRLLAAFAAATGAATPATCSSSSRSSGNPTVESSIIGFRVASIIPEPSTLLLLCFGSLAVLWRRRGLVCASILAAVVGISCADRAQAVTIDMVTVGNPGNAPDTRYNSISVGSVDHVYQIGKYEVTAGQYTEFLNAVAKADPNGLYNTPMGDPTDSVRRKHPANRFFAQLQLQRGRRLGQPAGELCELLGRGPVCQLAPQRPAHRRAGSGNDRGRRVSRCRQPDAVWTQRRRTVLHSHRGRVVQGGLPRSDCRPGRQLLRLSDGDELAARETISTKRPTRATTRITTFSRLCDRQPVLSHGGRRIRVVRQSLRHVRPRRQRVGVERNGCDQFVAWSAWRVVLSATTRERPACVLPQRPRDPAFEGDNVGFRVASIDPRAKHAAASMLWKSGGVVAETRFSLGALS